MGQCLSTDADPLIGTNVSIGGNNKKMQTPRKFPRFRNNELVIDNNNNNNNNNNNDSPMRHQYPVSPSEQTQPETPTAVPSPPAVTPPPAVTSPTTTSKTLVSMIAPFSRKKYQTTTRNDDFVPQHTQHTTRTMPQLSSPSILLDGLENIMIPEEVDPDAPSDEEESYQRYVDSTHEQYGISKWEMEPGPIISSATQKNNNRNRATSPPRPQSSIKSRYKHVTRPRSIRHHPLITPPPGSAEDNTLQQPPNKKSSVDRHTLAEFNKLKVQVQLQEHESRQAKRHQKFEERYDEVQASRKLMKEFEELQETASVHSQTMSEQQRQPSRMKRTDSFDLSHTDSWYFDFHSVDGCGGGGGGGGGAESENDDEENDNAATDIADDQSLTSTYSQQSHLSLLSASSMDSQRKYYAAKKHSKSATDKIDKLEKLLRVLNDKKGKKSPSAVVVGEEKKEDDYGPPSRRASFTSQMTTNSDYGPPSRQPNEDDDDSDDDEVSIYSVGSNGSKTQPAVIAKDIVVVATDPAATPKRSGKVPPGGRSQKTPSKRIQSPPPTKRSRDAPPDEKERSPRWRTFLKQSPSFLKMSPHNKTKSEKSPSYGAPPKASIASMSTEEFLHAADDFHDHALVSISKLETGDEENVVVVQARRLNFAGEEDDTTAVKSTLIKEESGEEQATNEDGNEKAIQKT